MKLDIPGLCDLDLVYVHALAEKSARLRQASRRALASRRKYISLFHIERDEESRTQLRFMMSKFRNLSSERDERFDRSLHSFHLYFVKPSAFHFNLFAPTVFSPTIDEALLVLAQHRVWYRSAKRMNLIELNRHRGLFAELVCLINDIGVEKHGW